MFHNAMLEPLFNQLKDDFDCLYSHSEDDIIAFSPDIVVLSDFQSNLFRSSLPNAIIVWTRHGIISKNYAASSIVQSDFACVTSQWVKEDFIRKKQLPRCGFWVTGFIPTDVIFNKPPLKGSSEWLCGASAGRPVILYAPTYNASLGSVDVLGEHWIDTVIEKNPDIFIVIKPHPHIPVRKPEWMDILRKAAARHHSVHLLEDCHTSVFELFTSVDILISDASSTIFFFLLCDKPIILIDNPSRHSDRERYDPEGIEWKWRDCGITMESVSQIPDAVSACLMNPLENQGIRARYRDLLFDSNTFGKAAFNTAERIRDLLNPSADKAEWIDSIWHMAARDSSLNHQLESMKVAANRKFYTDNAILMAMKKQLDKNPPLKKVIKGLFCIFSKNDSN